MYSEDVLEDRHIENLDLSVRAFHCLRSEGYYYVDDLTELTMEDVRNIRNMGRQAFIEIILKLDKFGFRLKDCPVEKYPDLESVADQLSDEAIKRPPPSPLKGTVKPKEKFDPEGIIHPYLDSSYLSGSNFSLEFFRGFIYCEWTTINIISGYIYESIRTV